MTREEWLDYFETVNGRKPSVQEMADALKAGEFVNEAPAKAEDTVTTEPVKVEAEIVETGKQLWQIWLLRNKWIPKRKNASQSQFCQRQSLSSYVSVAL